jgi:excisionase family DNA binding protein
MNHTDARPNHLREEKQIFIETPWLSAREAALYVGRRSAFAYKTMLFLARAGKIRAGNDGKTFRFRPEDLDTWLYLNGKKKAAR